MICFKEYYHKFNFNRDELVNLIYNIICNFIIRNISRYKTLEKESICQYRNNILHLGQENINFDGSTPDYKYYKYNSFPEIAIIFFMIHDNQKEFIQEKHKQTGIVHNKFYNYDKIEEPLIIEGVYKHYRKKQDNHVCINVYTKQKTNIYKVIKFLNNKKDYIINRIKDILIHESTHKEDEKLYNINDKIIKKYGSNNNRNLSWNSTYRSPVEINAIIHSLIYTYKDLEKKYGYENLKDMPLAQLIFENGNTDIFSLIINSPKWTKKIILRLNREGIPIRKSGLEHVISRKNRFYDSLSKRNNI